MGIEFARGNNVVNKTMKVKLGSVCVGYVGIDGEVRSEMCGEGCRDVSSVELGVCNCRSHFLAFHARHAVRDPVVGLGHCSCVVLMAPRKYQPIGGVASGSPKSAKAKAAQAKAPPKGKASPPNDDAAAYPPLGKAPQARPLPRRALLLPSFPGPSRLVGLLPRPLGAHPSHPLVPPPPRQA